MPGGLPSSSRASSLQLDLRSSGRPPRVPQSSRRDFVPFAIPAHERRRPPGEAVRSFRRSATTSFLSDSSLLRSPALLARLARTRNGSAAATIDKVCNRRPHDIRPARGRAVIGDPHAIRQRIARLSVQAMPGRVTPGRGPIATPAPQAKRRRARSRDRRWMNLPRRSRNAARPMRPRYRRARRRQAQRVRPGPPRSHRRALAPRRPAEHRPARPPAAAVGTTARSRAHRSSDTAKGPDRLASTVTEPPSPPLVQACRDLAAPSRIRLDRVQPAIRLRSSAPAGSS